jgi:SAM-dependent methyltransferase
MEKHHQLTHSRCELMWNSTDGATYYADMMEKCNWGDSLLHEIRQISNIKKMNFLDIGAGPGTHTIPLASQVNHITVVEPADGMLKYLKTSAKQKGLENIDYVKKRWEDINPGIDIQSEYDVIIASFSLGMSDIAAALKKMNQVGKKVFVLWHVGVPVWEEMYFALWEKIHNTSYYPVPKAETLLHVMHQIGIRPSVRVFDFDKFYRFRSLDEAVIYFMSELHAKQAEHQKIIQDYLYLHLKSKDNEFVLDSKTFYALISWENNGVNEG